MYSSESDDLYYRGGSDARVHRLNNNLQDTTKNLRTLDRMLDTYRDVGSEQKGAIDRLRGDVGKLNQDIRCERRRSRSRDGDLDASLSDDDYGRSSGRRGRSRTRKAAVRFADDMNTEIHEIHRNVRDLSSDQVKLEETLDREIDRRDRSETDVKRSLQEISDNLKRMPSQDPIAMRVERRLQQIQNEIRVDRQNLDRNDELSSMSSELKNALQHQHQLMLQPPQPSYLETKLQNQYLEVETQKHKIESDLDTIKRKLDQSEGSRDALKSQVDELRSQLSRADQERHRIRTHMEETKYDEEIRERKKKRTFEEEKDKRLQREIYELKDQLTRTVGAISEVDELRRKVEKSERQRAQLSDHIEVLTKDLENREKQTAKLITQLKDVSEKYDDVERHKGRMQSDVEDMSQKYKSTNRELEKLRLEFRDTQLSLLDTEKKKDEFKGRAQETVRQWKMKVKQLERELDHSKNSASHMISRNEQLVKDVESVRFDTHAYEIQINNFKRELADALAIRAAQDEQVRMKDIEVNELKSLKIDLERDVRDSKTVIDRLENDLSSAQARISTLAEDRSRLDSKLSAVETANVLLQDQTCQLKHDVKDLSAVKADMTGQLSEANGRIHDYRNSIVERQHKEKAAKEESEMYKKQLLEERETHKMTMEGLKREIQELKQQQGQVTNDLLIKVKRMQAETEASVEAIKLELSEERTALKIARRNEDKFKGDAEKLLREIQKYEEDNHKLLRKLEKLKQHFHNQVQHSEDDGSKVKSLEDQIINAECDLHKLERISEGIVKELNIEVNSVIELAHTDAVDKFQALSGPNGLPESTFLVADSKHKLQWLRCELKERFSRERKLRQELRDTLKHSDSDRQYLLTELSRRDGTIDELASIKQELVLKEFQNSSAVDDLEDKIKDLSDEIHIQKIKKKQHAVDDVEDYKESLMAREKIEERYSRLQETMRSLQDELKTVKMVRQDCT